MSAIVIDTNVLLVADGRSVQMSGACVVECLNRLERVKANEQTVLDGDWIILGEYHQKMSPNRPQTPGSAFLKWLLQVQKDVRHVSLVNITPLNKDCTLFAEFPPDKSLEADFDPADRKFVAAANAHPEKPPVLQAADSEWLGWEGRLAAHGIRLEVLCRCELERFRRRKGQ